MKNKGCVLLLLAAVADSACAVSITGSGTYSQNFDTLASSGAGNAWANNSTISGWYLFRQPSPGTAVTAYDAGTGSGSAGSFYSFGGSGSGERALGGIGAGTAYYGSPASGAIAGWIAAEFVNNSGSTLTEFTVQWNGEQWRNGGNASAQVMDFEYGFGATFGSVSTWNSTSGNFDFTSPVTGTTAAAVNGNTTGLVTGLGGTISGLTWMNNETLWLRWVERNDTGNDHGLAIDNFSFEAPAAAVPETLPFGFAAFALLGTLALGRHVTSKVARHGTVDSR